MYISHDLRKKNIAEYLLYMWQVEDIIRAYGCNLQRIREEYLSRFDVDEEKREELSDWYGDLIRMTNQEGCREGGHLQINKLVMQQLCELHDQLLGCSKYPFYSAEYYKVLPFIVELRHKGSSQDEHEIETCFNALYGVMLLRLQQKAVSPDTTHAIEEMTTLLGMLSDYFLKDKEGNLKIED
ncbi:MAG: DUF4924 family protein [Prevotella sp.]|nr:DUF4924 family protein [Prevotella sp.]